MRTLIYNANIITGDGKTILEDHSLVLDQRLIDGIIDVSSPNDFNCDRAIDARGSYVIPGIINHHTHAIVTGPADSGNAVAPYSAIRAVNNLNQHLSEGETTIINVDGFATMDEVNEVRALTPMLLQTFSLHSPLHFEFAKLVDLGGLKEKHCSITAEEMIRQGAVGMGEVGGISDISYYSLCYIPSVIKKKTGVEVSQQESEFLCDCLFAQPMDKQAAEKFLAKRGISSAMEGLEELVERSKHLFEIATKSVWEAAKVVSKEGGVLLMHNSPDTMTQVLELAKELNGQLIAAHSNYLYKPHEAIEMARAVKKSGGWVDIHTGDFLRGRRILFPNHATALALLIEGLVDLVSTDWSCGYWDSILRMLEFAVSQNVIDLPQAITLATSNVLQAIPNVAPDRGEIAEGKIADVVIVSKKRISDVQTVIIGGEVCVDEGALVSRLAK
jgi:alpha-D-ribose 1-methylphosphonate 5-triphosphate diphosphatase PhnM